MKDSARAGQNDHLPITALKGVGPKVAARLARLDIHSVEDLLFHLPYRYEDRTRITPIGALRVGDEAVIQGKVELTEIKFARRRILLSRLSDGTGFITLRFFHFTLRQQAALARGVTLRCFGEVRRGSLGLVRALWCYRLCPGGRVPISEFPMHRDTTQHADDEPGSVNERWPGMDFLR